MLTYRRVLLFIFLAAFGREVAAAIRWALSALATIAAQPALWGLGRSGLALLAEAALIWGALRLVRAGLAGRHGAGRDSGQSGRRRDGGEPWAGR
jgi:hypothetical protein